MGILIECIVSVAMIFVVSSFMISSLYSESQPKYTNMMFKIRQTWGCITGNGPLLKLVKTALHSPFTLIIWI